MSTASALALIVGQGSYIGEIYTDPPRRPARWVFFTTEHVHMRIVITNDGSHPDELVFSEPEFKDAFVITVTKGQRPVPNSFRLDAVKAYSPDGRSLALLPGDRITLEPGDVVQWDVMTEPLDVGIYEVTVSPNGTDRQGLRVRPRAPTFVYEVRSGSEWPLEPIRRAAQRAIDSGRLAEASQLIGEMRRLHPEGFAAMLLESQIATARGMADAARSLREKALEILVEEKDAIFFKMRSPAEVATIKEGLRKR